MVHVSEVGQERDDPLVIAIRELPSRALFGCMFLLQAERLDRRNTTLNGWTLTTVDSAGRTVERPASQGWFRERNPSWSREQGRRRRHLKEPRPPSHPQLSTGKREGWLPLLNARSRVNLPTRTATPTTPGGLIGCGIHRRLFSASVSGLEQSFFTSCNVPTLRPPPAAACTTSRRSRALGGTTAFQVDFDCFDYR